MEFGTNRTLAVVKLPLVQTHEAKPFPDMESGVCWARCKTGAMGLTRAARETCRGFFWSGSPVKPLFMVSIGTCSVADDFFEVCPDDATTSCGRSGR